MSDLQDRFRGCLVGLAVGDALGAPVEFSARGPKSVEYQQAVNWKLPAGGWTDDTAQALCLAEGLLATGDLSNVMDLFVRWMEEGHNACTGRAVGIGGTVLNSLMTYRVTGKIVPPTDEHSAGNGCIMRLAPVVMHAYMKHIMLKRPDANGMCTMYWEPFPKVLDAAEASCKLTHGARDAIAATRMMAVVLANTFSGHGNTPEWMFSSEWDTALFSVERLKKLRTKTAEGTIEHKFGNTYYTETDLKSDGYSVNTLECALWAFYSSNSFEDGMRKAIELGGDTDTVGAVYGQIAGACYGYKAIPQRWKDGLMWHDKIVQYADSLFNVPMEGPAEYERLYRLAEQKQLDGSNVPKHLR